MFTLQHVLDSSMVYPHLGVSVASALVSGVLLHSAKLTATSDLNVKML